MHAAVQIQQKSGRISIDIQRIYTYTRTSIDMFNLCVTTKTQNINIKIYRNKLWPVVLYGYETRSLTLREEHRLTFFENKVLMRIFGPKREEVTRKWRKLHIKERNDLYSSPNIIRAVISRRTRWAGHETSMGESSGVYRVLVGRSE